MSGLKGKGGGCYAKRETLAADVGTDVTRFSKCLSNLISWGYVAREPQLIDKRRFTLRVVYGGEQGDQPATQSGDQLATYRAEIGGESAPDDPEIGDHANAKNGGFSKENDRHYSSLREELDFDKSNELNSPKGPGLHFSDDDDVLDSIFSSGRFHSERSARGKDTAKAVATEWALGPYLPSNLSKLPLGAQVSKIEAAFNAIGRNADLMAENERSMFSELLYNISDEYGGGDLDAVAQQAIHLWEEMAVF
ncbi:hypothetical protein [Croceicoccus sp. Ery5]|uniref:hypothetical protein n=1 Tax=Croceicoccus sp. Ery5 TaxID=1703340 RepID=UPI001E3E540F|nr:hypothetical protein [Croceicoccus sp. Ery5]